MKLQNILAVLIVMLLCSTAQAQQKFKYTYDETGNRTKRELVITMALMAAVDSSEVEEEALSLGKTAELLADSNSLGQQDAFKVQIFPNPSRGAYTLELPELQDGEQGLIQVYSMFGQLVQEYRAIYRTQSVDITGAQPGYYFIKIIVGDKIVFKTLIKE